ncbi:MAG: carboxypeptidase-like regulatory domain-containing protein [Phycisphaerales bacterium JB043]
MKTRAVAILISVLVAMVCAGCVPAYTLRGRVIPGDISYSLVVGDADERIVDGPGIGGVKVRLVSDPDKLRRELMGEAITNPDGTFEIPFKKVGTGMMLYSVGLTARADGYAPTISSKFNLPSESRRVLILMTPGVDTYQDPLDNTPGSMADQYNR